MKILYYNWIAFDDPAGRGGGVTLYQKNIIEYLIANTEHQIYFISSGREFSDRRAELYIEETKNIFGDRCHSYVIVNSPILATGNYLGAEDLKQYLEDMSLYHLLKKFMTEQGGFDVVHFNNLEGLSLNVLRLKDCFRSTRFIYSLHNYYPFCTQVNLWKNGEKNCDGYQDGKACPCCHSDGISSQRIREKLALSRDFGNGFYTEEEYRERMSAVDRKYSVGISKKEQGTEKSGEGQIFKHTREKNIDFLQRYTDRILAVSERTHRIALDMGLRHGLVVTDYIGTRFADMQKGYCIHPYKGGLFCLAYLGYARKEKGFFFFLETCETMPEGLAGRLSVVIAAKTDDESILKRIRALDKKFTSVRFFNGYTKEDMPEILGDVHLGIVPVLWEDNLPQVAIEMTAMGIPVLSADCGGAGELTAEDGFRFQVGNKGDFYKKLGALMEGPDKLMRYFEKGRHLVTMEEHVAKLLEYYKM